MRYIRVSTPWTTDAVAQTPRGLRLVLIADQTDRSRPQATRPAVPPDDCDSFIFR